MTIKESYNKRFGSDTVSLINTVHDAIDSEVIQEEAKKFAKENSLDGTMPTGSVVVKDDKPNESPFWQSYKTF